MLEYFKYHRLYIFIIQLFKIELNNEIFKHIKYLSNKNNLSLVSYWIESLYIIKYTSLPSVILFFIGVLTAVRLKSLCISQSVRNDFEF